MSKRVTVYVRTGVETEVAITSIDKGESAASARYVLKAVIVTDSSLNP